LWAAADTETREIVATETLPVDSIALIALFTPQTTASLPSRRIDNTSWNESQLNVCALARDIVAVFAVHEVRSVADPLHFRVHEHDTVALNAEVETARRVIVERHARQPTVAYREHDLPTAYRAIQYVGRALELVIRRLNPHGILVGRAEWFSQ